jgi:hypothetical protein
MKLYRKKENTRSGEGDLAMCIYDFDDEGHYELLVLECRQEKLAFKIYSKSDFHRYYEEPLVGSPNASEQTNYEVLNSIQAEAIENYIAHLNQTLEDRLYHE